MNGRMNGSVRVEGCDSIDEVMAILGGGYRMEIVRVLAQQRAGVTTIAETLDLGLPTISQNLRILKQGGLVAHERCKTAHIYHLTKRVRVRQADERIWIATEAQNGDAILVRSTALPDLRADD